MKKASYLYIILFAIVSFAFINQSGHPKAKIIFQKEYTIINTDTFYLNKARGKDMLDRIKKALNEDPKKHCEKKDGMIYYYFKNQGIKLSATIERPKWPSMIEINFNSNKNLTKKIHFYEGEVKLFDVKIDKKTTFKELFNNPRINNLIDFGYYNKESKNVFLGYFIINTEYASYSVFFDGYSNESAVTYINAYL